MAIEYKGFFDRDTIMKQWDSWRVYIAEDGKGSWPRDAFEALLDYFEERLQSDVEGGQAKQCGDCGNKDLIRALSIIKTNTDSGVFVPIQKAAMKALEVYDDFVPKLRVIYSKRRKIIQKYLSNLGWQYHPSDATIYVWVKIGSKDKDSMKFVVDLISKKACSLQELYCFLEN